MSPISTCLPISITFRKLPRRRSPRARRCAIDPRLLRQLAPPREVAAHARLRRSRNASHAIIRPKPVAPIAPAAAAASAGQPDPAAADASGHPDDQSRIAPLFSRQGPAGIDARGAQGWRNRRAHSSAGRCAVRAVEASVAAGAVEGRVSGGALQMLTPTEGVDFTDYLARVLASVKRNWYAVMPESARLGDGAGLSCNSASCAMASCPRRSPPWSAAPARTAGPRRGFLDPRLDPVRTAAVRPSAAPISSFGSFSCIICP